MLLWLYVFQYNTQIQQIGIPVLTYLILASFGVPKIAKRKIQQAQLTALIAKYMLDTDVHWKFHRTNSKLIFDELDAPPQPKEDVQGDGRLFSGFEALEHLNIEQLGDRMTNCCYFLQMLWIFPVQLEMMSARNATVNTTDTVTSTEWLPNTATESITNDQLPLLLPTLTLD